MFTHLVHEYILIAKNSNNIELNRGKGKHCQHFGAGPFSFISSINHSCVYLSALLTLRSIYLKSTIIFCTSKKGHYQLNYDMSEIMRCIPISDSKNYLNLTIELFLIYLFFTRN